MMVRFAPTRRQLAHMKRVRPFKMRSQLYRMRKVADDLDRPECFSPDAEAFTYWEQRRSAGQKSVALAIKDLERGLIDKYEFRTYCLELLIARLMCKMFAVT